MARKYNQPWFCDTCAIYTIITLTATCTQATGYLLLASSHRLWKFKLLFCVTATGFRFLFFGSGSFSSPAKTCLALLPRQFPQMDLLQNELTTHRACVFLQKSDTVGLSCVPPLWHWQAKHFSIGSWQIFWLRKNLTPGRVNTYLTRVIKECAALKRK